MSLKLIVGLGNPEQRYNSTRHNVGFWVLDNLAEKISKDFVIHKKYESEYFEYEYNARVFHIMKPMSYINNSGVPIKKFIKNKNIDIENILIIYDDLDLDVGKIRLKLGGGSGGHNGLNSIIEQVGSKNFWRLRIGIGKPQDKDKIIDYVLGKPTKEDRDTIYECIDVIINEIDNFFRGESTKLMNKMNGENRKDGI